MTGTIAIGDVFGHWTVLSLPRLVGKASCVLCRCTCGMTKAVRVRSLRIGETTSCGCVGRAKKAAMDALAARLGVTRACLDRRKRVGKPLDAPKRHAVVRRSEEKREIRRLAQRARRAKARAAHVAHARVQAHARMNKAQRLRALKDRAAALGLA